MGLYDLLSDIASSFVPRSVDADAPSEDKEENSEGDEEKGEGGEEAAEEEEEEEEEPEDLKPKLEEGELTLTIFELE